MRLGSFGNRQSVSLRNLKKKILRHTGVSRSPRKYILHCSLDSGVSRNDGGPYLSRPWGTQSGMRMVDIPSLHPAAYWLNARVSNTAATKAAAVRTWFQAVQLVT